MDIATVKNIILENVRSFLNFPALLAKAKEALKLPYAKTYIALALLFVLIFFIFTFPYDMLLRKQLTKMEKGLFKNIYVGEINFSLIDIISLSSIYTTLESGSEISIRSADIDISIIRLLLQKDIKGTIQLAGFKYVSENSQVDFNLNGNIFLDFTNFDNPPTKGDFNILMDNAILKFGNITLPESMGGLPLELPVIKISSIKAESNIENQKINIKNIRIFGKDLNGSISGSIAISKQFMNSSLNLKLIIDGKSEALKNYQDFLASSFNDRNQLVLSLKGSLFRPRIDLGSKFTGEAKDGTRRPREHPMDKVIPVP